MTTSPISNNKATTMLIVLDGFGHSDKIEDNAIAAANTPTWDQFKATRPHTLISSSGLDVGLPDGQMGNSEVGHMSLGAGRVIYQDFTRINLAIEQGEFEQNPALTKTLTQLQANQGALHVMGLLSPGGVHSHEDQIFAMLRMAGAAGINKIYLHGFLDGRDTPPRSAAASLVAAESVFAEIGVGQVASICGRYFAMDRDNRWDRVERAYNLLVRGEAPFHAKSSAEALELAYARDENDEFVQPTAIHNFDSPPVSMADGDAIVFMNFRADRAREISRAILHKEPEQKFEGFERRSQVALSDFVMLTHYADDIKTSCAFAPASLHNTFGQYVADQGKTQLRIAETEKYAHVTFFFSGGREQPFQGEERILVDSPDVATYDLQPEMSAPEVTDKLIEAIQSGHFDTIVCNYANGDMVGHTGIFDAAVQAVETLDTCLGRLSKALEDVGGQMLITADHGNVEQMLDHHTGQAHTAHTCEPVPLVYVGPAQLSLTSGGTLTDIAPTVLHLMGCEVPPEMTGTSLATLQE